MNLPQDSGEASNPFPASEEDLEAIREALKAMDEVRMRPFEEFDAEFRARHNLLDT